MIIDSIHWKLNIYLVTVLGTKNTNTIIFEMKIMCVVLFMKSFQALGEQWLRDREFGKYWGIISERW